MNIDIKKVKVLGIDPGFSGAIALYNVKTGILEHVWDMPISYFTKRKARKKLNKEGILMLLDMHLDTTALAVIEEVHAGPNDGRVSAFRFGQQYGILEMALCSLGIPFYPVLPAVWKTSMGLSSNKNESRALATKKFPNKKVYFFRNKDDGRAEAALLATIGINLLHHEIKKKAFIDAKKEAGIY